MSLGWYELLFRLIQKKEKSPTIVNHNFFCGFLPDHGSGISGGGCARSFAQV